MTRWEIEIVSVGASEIRVHAGRRIGPIHAPVGVTPQTEVAVVTGEDGGVDHAVPLFDGRAQSIRRDALAQLCDYACALVPHDASCSRQRHIHLITPPHVQVRATDPGLGHAQQHGPRLWRRDIIFFNLEGFAILFADDNTFFHCYSPSPGYSQDNSADAQAIRLATACSPYHTICREGWIATVWGRRLQSGYKTPTLFGTFCTPCSRSILQAVTL